MAEQSETYRAQAEGVWSMVHSGNRSGGRPKQEAPRPLALLRRRALVPAADLLYYHGGAAAAADVADEGHVGRPFGVGHVGRVQRRAA
jgi:hypothetical protein